MTAYRTRGGKMSGQRMPSFTTLICDAEACRTTAVQGDTATHLRQAARQMGWVRVDNKDYCPNHACERECKADQ